MRSIDELEALLRQWGRYFGERRDFGELSENDYAPDVHPLAIGMRNAPGKRKAVVVQALKRGGYERRMMMGAAAGLVDDLGKPQPLPQWAVDPVYFPETRPAVFGQGETASRAPTELLQVERVAFQLKAFDELAGLCVRTEYCRLGARAEKAAHVQAAYSAGGEVGSRRYREALAMGRGFMYARLTLPAARP